jgi:hypothetical protein
VIVRENVSWISTPTRPKAVSGSTSRPGRGRQPIHGWWAPIAQSYIEEVGATARSTRFAVSPQTPSTTLATEGALEWREAPPSPPRTSCFITHTQCDRPHLCRFVNAALTEPAPSLPPLHQAEEAPTTHRQRLPPLLMVGAPPLLFLVIVSLC